MTESLDWEPDSYPNSASVTGRKDTQRNGKKKEGRKGNEKYTG